MIRIAFANRAARWVGFVALVAVCLPFWVTAPLAAAVSAVVNTATITADNAAIANNPATVTTPVQLSIIAIPALSRVGLAVFAILLGAGALVISRRRAQRQS